MALLLRTRELGEVQRRQHVRAETSATGTRGRWVTHDQQRRVLPIDQQIEPLRDWWDRPNAYPRTASSWVQFPGGRCGEIDQRAQRLGPCVSAESS